MGTRDLKKNGNMGRGLIRKMEGDKHRRGTGKI